MKTQIGIVGAGPAGLLLAHLLHLCGIESIVLETRSRSYVESRIRAGVLEQGTVDLLKEVGLGERLQREGLVHRGVNLRFSGETHHIDFMDLTGGKAITVYGQHEVVKDMIAARLGEALPLLFEVTDVSLRSIEEPLPSIRFTDMDGNRCEMMCDFIAGCDGFHGVSRASIPTGVLTQYEREYPLAWLGILAESEPISEELIYARHERGFALFSMRSPILSRLYVQCAPDDPLEWWPDERVWEELRLRLGGEDLAARLKSGPVLQKGITAMRSVVYEPMSYGRLYLAGDAAHIVPPTGAKGMNLAVADVSVLASAFGSYYERGSMEGLHAYTDLCLGRVWKAERFSSWVTSMLHRYEHYSPFDRRLQLAELEYLTSSRAAMESFAENYVGLPMPALNL